MGCLCRVIFQHFFMTFLPASSQTARFARGLNESSGPVQHGSRGQKLFENIVNELI